MMIGNGQRFVTMSFSPVIPGSGRRGLIGWLIVGVWLSVGPSRGQSVARVWNEEILAAIRLDRPNPPVHARNLFHLAAAMYDCWAAYDEKAVGCLYHERAAAADVVAARREAISYAAYNVLRIVERGGDASGAGRAHGGPRVRPRVQVVGWHVSGCGGQPGGAVDPHDLGPG
jgi:hypothetical protein